MLWLLPPAAFADDVEQVGTHLDQARFFIKRQWYDDALAELEKAAALPDGRIDPQVWYLLATVRYELADLEGARQAAARAHSYSRNDEQLQLAAGLSGFFNEQFGVAEVRAPYAGMTGTLDIALESTLFDPNLKLYLSRADARYDGKLTFPVRVGLPAGTYRINGQQVVVAPGQDTIVALEPANLTTARAPLAQLARAEIGVGMSFWTGAAVHNLLPALTTEVALTQPVGPLVLGVLVDWTSTGFATLDGGQQHSTAAWSLGGRAGWELPGTGDLVVRPSLGYRYGYLPGIERRCTSEGEGFRCTDDGPTDLLVYAIGRAHITMAELSIDHLDRDRKSGLGLGVKVAGEQAFGVLPDAAEAKLASEDTAVSYTVDESARSFSATGARFLLNLSLAF